MSVLLMQSSYVTGSDAAVAAILSSYIGLGSIPFIAPETSEGARDVVPAARAASPGTFENLPGVYLQASLLSLTFEDTDHLTKQKQILSLCLSGVAMMKLAYSHSLVPASDWQDQQPFGIEKPTGRV